MKLELPVVVLDTCFFVSKTHPLSCCFGNNTKQNVGNWELGTFNENIFVPLCESQLFICIPSKPRPSTALLPDDNTTKQVTFDQERTLADIAKYENICISFYVLLLQS